MFVMNSKWLTFWTLEYTFIWVILRNILPCNDFITNITSLALHKFSDSRLCQYLICKSILHHRNNTLQ